LKANIKETAWSLRDTELESYKFSTVGMSLYTCPALLKAELVSMGPALVPLVPAPGEPKSAIAEDISLDFKFALESLSMATTIDFSQFILTLPDGKTINPDRVMTWQGTKEIHVSCNTLYDYKQIPIQQFVITNSTRYFAVRFPIPSSKVEQCIVELGTVKIDGKNVDVPPLRFKKDSDYKFRPFVLPLPS
jgi:hypothetical protein